MKRLVGRGSLLLLAIAVALSAVIWLHLTRGPSLAFPGPVNPVSVGIGGARMGDRWSIGTEGTICLDKPGRVELTGVAPVRPQGLRVIDFALRPNQNWKRTKGFPGEFLGEVQQPLQDLGFVSRTVDVACKQESPRGYELAVRVLKTTSGPAVASGWVVTYRGAGHSGTLQIPFGILLCAAKTAGDESCHIQNS